MDIVDHFQLGGGSGSHSGLSVITEPAWVSVGWHNIDPGECSTVHPHRLTNRYFYVYVSGNSYKGKKGSLCVDPINRFRIEQKDDDPFECHKEASGRGEWRQFSQVDVGDHDNHTLNITP